MPSTIRVELDRLGFDWKHGRLLLQHDDPRTTLPGPVEELTPKDVRLDEPFSNGIHGTLYAPRVLAKDGEYLYYMHRGRQAVEMVRYAHKLDKYLETPSHLPYPD